jgi:hypothetical protein
MIHDILQVKKPSFSIFKCKHKEIVYTHLKVSENNHLIKEFKIALS